MSPKDSREICRALSIKLSNNPKAYSKEDNKDSCGFNCSKFKTLFQCTNCIWPNV
jgi:hypothetical protein